MARDQMLSSGEQFTSILQKGFKGFAEIQKSVFQVYEQNTKSALESAKQMFPITSPFFEMAAQAFSEFLKTQKRSLDHILNQSTPFMNAVSSNSFYVENDGIGKLVRDSAEYFISMQKNAADFAAQQTHKFADTMKSESNSAGTPASSAADAIHRGTEAVVQAQKQFWDMMLKPFEERKFEASAKD